MKTIEELLKDEARWREIFLSARANRRLANEECAFALKQLQHQKELLYKAGFTGNIMRDENGERIMATPTKK